MSLQVIDASPLLDGSTGYESTAGDEPVQSSAPGYRASQRVRILPKYARTAVDAVVHYRWTGPLGAPTVIVLGGISAGRDVCRHGAVEGWWDDLVGPGRAVDVSQRRVLSIEWLATADLDGANAVASEDQADALAALLDALKIDQVQALIGASYGAMVGLAFAARHPARLARLIAISGAHRAHPLATALRSIQRQIIRNGIDAGSVEPALALARQLAMTTYRGAEEFAQRFDEVPEFRDGKHCFAVEDYLIAAGRKFVARFDAQRYLALSESIDLHRVNPACIVVPTTLIAVDSDRLVPSQDLRDLASALANATLHELESRYGHDAFLKEPARIGALIAATLNC
ncbi:MAG: homoserine O-succinyltransferase [Tahibacter sp.]